MEHINRERDRRLGEDDRRSGEFQVPTQIWVWVVNFLVTGLLTYGAVNARVAVVESKQLENERRLQRIEEKIDRLVGIATGERR
jgi:hypothetical protein